MAKQQRRYDDDDGRVICNMDVPGMPWHDKAIRREKRATRRSAQVVQGNQMTRAETWRFTWNAMLSGMLIALVFSGVLVLFTLFCTQIWFR